MAIDLKEVGFRGGTRNYLGEPLQTFAGLSISDQPTIYPAHEEWFGDLPAAQEVLTSFSDRFNSVVGECSDILPLQIIAAQTLSDAVTMLRPLIENDGVIKNSFFSVDCDGVIAYDWFMVWRYINRFNKALLRAKLNDETWKTFIGSPRKHAEVFRKLFAHDGVVAISEINSLPGNQVAIATDRFPVGFGTQALSRLFLQEHDIVVHTAMRRGKGGKDSSMKKLFSTLSEYIKTIDLNAPINITLVSDILHKQTLHSMSTKGSDSGGEGEYLGKLILEIKKMIEARITIECPGLQTPPIQAAYCAINENFPPKKT